MNLTAIRERGQQITKHLLDSLSMQPYVRGARIVDIGTGAGFPGLPLAIVRSRAQFTLLDSTAKKLKFIEHVAQMLGLRNVANRAHARRKLSAEGAFRHRGVARRRAGRDVREVVRTSVCRRRATACDEGTLPDGRAAARAERMETRGGPST